MYQKVFLAEIDQLYLMLDFIRYYGQSHHVLSYLLDQIILAAEEALVNVISYGYSEKKKGIIEIACEELTPNLGMKLVIKDQGIPFNPIEKEFAWSFKNSKSDYPIGGYGINLLKGLMDKIEYQRVNEENILTLTKYF